jgi:undecaprenyl-phosphate 4-deoxy-4-formamido-L-arabinose transferase
MLISFVIPCYRSENTLAHVVDTIQETVASKKGFEAEIILVNDCSPDNTWGVIMDLHNKYGNVTGIDIAKNSGQQCAIMAGLRHAKGELIAVSDDDGQTPVSAAVDMIHMLFEQDLDVVCAKYTDRGKRSLFRRFGSWVNDQMVKYFLDKPDDINTSVFLCARRFVIEEMMRYNNPYPFMSGLLLRTTYRIGNLDLTQRARLSGQSGYTFRSLFRLWMNGITTFSVKPLRIAVLFGVLFALAGFLAVIAVIIEKLVVPDVSIGWTSLIATILLVGGVILIVLGLIGEYVGRIYLSLNSTPQFVVRTVIGKDAREAAGGSTSGISEKKAEETAEKED